MGVGAWCMAAGAVAAPRTVVVAADCSDPALINAVRDFRIAAEPLLGSQLLESESVLDIVRPRPTRSLQDVERQVESARALFYGGQPERALELVDRALAELDRASPEAQPAPVIQQSLVLRALVLKALDRPKDMSDTLRRLARLDPAFKLDPDAHPPSAIAALEAVKKELARTKKTAFTVRVEAGPAATVFIDGHALGLTPLKLELTPGTYRVQLTAPGLVSFPHRVEVPRDTKLAVDLAFEGGVGQQAPVCLLPGTDEGAALKLGQLVTAERAIVLRNTAQAGAPTVISGALFELSSGKQERVAAVPPAHLGKLAAFLVTGQEQAGLQLAPASAAATAPALKETPVVFTPSPLGAGEAPAAPSRAGRVASFTLLGVGGAAALSGVLVWAGGAESRRRLVGITRSDGTFFPSSTEAGREALGLLKTVDGINTATLGLVAGGAGAIIAGVVGLVLFPAAEATVVVAPSPGGASVQLSGRF